MKNVDWLSKCVDRFETEARSSSQPEVQEYANDRRKVTMDLFYANESCGGKLNFERLHGFARFDFMHDMVGIANHINRETAKLEGGFYPRCGD